MHKCRELPRTSAYRADSRSPDWVGYMVAKVLKINAVPGADNKSEDLARIKQILKTWYKNKVFKIESREDEHRHKKQFVVPGPWAGYRKRPRSRGIHLAKRNCRTTAADCRTAVA